MILAPPRPSGSFLPLKVALSARLRWRSCDQSDCVKRSRRGRKSPSSIRRWCNVQKSLHVRLKEPNVPGFQHSPPGEPEEPWLVLKEKISFRASLKGVSSEEAWRTTRIPKSRVVPSRIDPGENARERRSRKRETARRLSIPYDPPPSYDVSQYVHAWEGERHRRWREIPLGALAAPTEEPYFSPQFPRESERPSAWRDPVRRGAVKRRHRGSRR